MARKNKIKSVVVHYPSVENEEEFELRVANAMAKVLCKNYPPEIINKLIDELR
ncbi:hypothetical protein [Clostridium cochlearium]|uniref:hypothetical protein n=1 Tax=Clostridium cochlearium TaxID=1494 RepID=UPI000B94DB90|nr:hypothetical protein [Clostridium cochlearium]SNV76748.1 Uncharacterised protein [Clostridium cochlearium]STA92596.1 Uncharacterised protein [Clostridium cochlearium]